MYSKLDKAKKNAQGAYNNAGSCVKLASYLMKEAGDEKTFFSHFEDRVGLENVMDKIDNNKRTLKNKQEKFYALSYNPSNKEIKHIVKLLTGKEVRELSELTKDERKLVFNEFRSYVRECMNIYAQNFNRERDLSAEDLVYFGQMEEFRYYSIDDQEVKLGLKKRGEKKEGLNLHAHVIVSRMDTTQTIALSPRTNSRGNTNLLNGKSVKNGFNLKKWQCECFESFSNEYRYVASYEEKFYHHKRGYEQFSNCIKNKIFQEVMEGMEEERKAIGFVQKIALVNKSPKVLVKSYLKRKIKDILSDKDSCI